MEEIVLKPLVFVAWHVVENRFHLFYGLDSVLSLPGTVPLWFSSILVSFLALHVENVVDTMSLDLILKVLWEMLGHLDVVH